MSKKKEIKEATETTTVTGHFGGKNQMDPYAAGRSETKRGKQKTPWYMKSLDEVEASVKSSLYETKKKALQEAKNTVKSTFKVSLSVAGGKPTRKYIDEFKGITNLYVKPESLSTNKDFKQMIQTEGGLSSLLNVDGKDAKTVPSKEKPFEDAELAQHDKFEPKFEKTDLPGSKKGGFELK